MSETHPGTTDHKFVAILNKKVEPGRVLNACAHMAVAISSTADDAGRTEMRMINYEDKDGNPHHASALPFVVLKADNSNQIRTARQNARELGIHLVDFTSSMSEGTYLEQMDRTKQTNEEALEYWGLCLFGQKQLVDQVTKKFSLWR